MSSKIRLILIFFIFLIAFPFVSSLGIGLFVSEVNFEPNLNQEFNAFINNNMGYDARIKLSANGNLAQYVKFSEEYIDIPAGGRKYITFILALPEQIPGGRNRIDIGGEDVTSLASGGISSKTAAYMGFYVRAPYPGKFLEGSLNVADIEEDGIADLNINIISRGDEVIDKLEGVIEIFDHENRVGSLSIPAELEIKPGETRNVNIKWDSTGQRVGEYSAKANLTYSDKGLILGNQFRIGTLLLKIINYTKEVYQNEINKFDIEIQSFWNQKIEGVYGKVEVEKEKAKTDKIDLGIWSKALLEGYIDTSDIGLGEHEISIKVYYENKIAEEVGKITVLGEREKIVELPSKIPPMSLLLIVLISLLVLGNVLLVVYILKRGKTAKRK